MPDRRVRRGSLDDLLPQDPRARLRWAHEVWRDQAEVALSPSGAWMLREAGRILGLADEVVDAVLKGTRP